MSYNAKRYFKCSRCKAEFWIPLDQSKGFDECMSCGYPLRRQFTKKQLRAAIGHDEIIVRRKIIRRKVKR